MADNVLTETADDSTLTGSCSQVWLGESAEVDGVAHVWNQIVPFHQNSFSINSSTPTDWTMVVEPLRSDLAVLLKRMWRGVSMGRATGQLCVELCFCLCLSLDFIIFSIFSVLVDIVSGAVPLHRVAPCHRHHWTICRRR